MAEMLAVLLVAASVDGRLRMVDADIVQHHSCGPFGTQYQIAWRDGEILDYDTDCPFDNMAGPFYQAPKAYIYSERFIFTNGENSPILLYQERKQKKPGFSGIWH